MRKNIGICELKTAEMSMRHICPTGRDRVDVEPSLNRILEEKIIKAFNIFVCLL